MPDNQFPVDPADDSRRLPTNLGTAERTLPATVQPINLSLDTLSDTRRDEIDLLAYWRILLKRRWLVLGVLATATALALLASLLTTPIFRATNVIQIEREALKVVNMEGVTPVEGAGDFDFYQTQYELLKSRSLAERVVQDLQQGGIDVTAEAGQSGWTEHFLALIRPRPSQRLLHKQTDAGQLRTAVRIVQEGLVIEPVRDSRLVRINFDSPNPALSARAANAFADGYIAAGIERRFGASSYAKKYLEEQLKLVKSRLEDSERKLVGFAQKEQIVSAGDGKSLVGQNLIDLNTALAAAQDQRIRAQSRWQQAQGARGAALPADMLTNSILRTLQQQRADLSGQYQQKLQVYKPDYPSMLQLNGQIKELERQISGELANIRASVKAEYDGAASHEAMLKSQLASLRDQSLDVDSRSIQYNILKREVDTNRQLYDGLLQRYKQVGVTGNESGNNISVIDRAQAPIMRFKPSIVRYLAAGLLAGLVLGVFLALLLEYVDDTLKTPEDIEQRLRLSVLGIIPKLRKESPAQAQADQRSGFSEAYRSVRTALQFSTEQGVPRILMLTSPSSSEGKSTSALMLARNFAQLGKRVLLIEGDLRNPSLAKAFGLRSDVGLSSMLAGAAALADVILNTDRHNLKIILAGPLPPNPAELLAGSKLVALLTVAMERFDQIIIDGPPVLGIADAPILANVATGTLLIVESGKTRIATAQASVKRLGAARARLIGTLLTKYNAKIAGYGYSYESYYSYGANPRLTKR